MKSRAFSRGCGYALLLLCSAARCCEAAMPAELGRALYQGHRPWQLGAAATTAGLPAEFSACARCHGPLGEGGIEGGQPIPPLDSGRLFREDGGLPAFANDEAVLAAIEKGAGRGGRSLSMAMPRFRLKAAERRALIAYLHRLGSPADLPPGVSHDRVRIGVPIPTRAGDTAAMSIQKGLLETVDAANAAGGIHGRHVSLHFAPLGEIQRLMAGNQLYALAGGWLGSEAGVESGRELEDWQRRFRVSHVASLTPRVETADLNTSWTAPLLPSLRELYTGLVQAMRDACPGVGTEVLLGSRKPWDRLGIPTSASVDNSGAVRVFMVGKQASDSLRQLLTNKTQRGAACLGCLTLMHAIPADVPPGWRVFAALPVPTAMLADLAARRASIWESLGRLAGTALVESLAEAGPRLHERSLLQALARFNGRPLEPGLRLVFSPARMHGFPPEIIESAPSTPASTSFTAVHSSLGD
ncbi:cytochrome c/ABC transporter substrate-binding protein [Methyloterricola oryzae]|uniref:cytochrome c/ABC transporter substrate-binding protein n=1 Tax=Methyloterricola oryzae TaxID=1495050 RepID=UPI0005EBCE0F|nr:c-type cytochrome [Methyloterricola oryzae]